MSSASQSPHPGPHIRCEVLPKKMSVTEAARLLDVGRPALSNLLNRNAALSPDMAARLERAFGANARELVDMQSAYDAAVAREKGAAASTKAYVPPFLQFKANDIEDWTRSISTRSRLAVLLRTLVHSTGLEITAADFPGNDDSQRPGWDGFVEAGEATPWVPLGKSGWEFGVSGDVKTKADGDFEKSVELLPAKERSAITFVFVTPRRWPGKTVWQKKRRSEKRWKDVRVYDASDIEQWLEQSIPGQAWFAHERGVPTEGVLSLDGCWQKWVADCTPPLVPSLFDEAISEARQTIAAKLARPTPDPVVITADSRDEALAFLHCVFTVDEPDLAALRARIVVFSEPGALTKLASKSANFIPVVISRAVEKELAPHTSLRAILVYPRNATNAEADITLEPLSYAAFEKALQEMGCSRDDIDRLGRESGRSLTVLRRRLSRLEAIRMPEWASDAGHTASLVPFLMAGTWNSSNHADQAILSLLADDTPYPALENQIASLDQLDDAPVWRIGTFRGLISKIDALFAISKHITQANLDRFFDVASLVLSEDDPSLDLPEEKRWMAGVYGKTREISAALRDGISETLVLLAVHGAALFRGRMGIDPELQTRRLIRELLLPLTARKLEAHSGDLPMYAEASPGDFLEILEADLASPDPETLKLLRPASSGVFGSCPRTGLLWALENTAWAPEHLLQTVRILARLAGQVIQDNWVNKPGESLSAIFRCWMPQTAANVERRIAALEYLVEHYPKVAWPLCVEQFDGRSTVGDYSHKPRWRPDARGHGEPVTIGEMRAFALRALELALDWTAHDRETLGDLVASLGWLDKAQQTRVWDLVDRWSQTASDEDRAWLREKVRVTTLTQRARKRQQNDGKQPKQDTARARRTYHRLQPTDLVLQHAWLFRQHWVEESADEVADEIDDYEKRDERISAKRINALRAVVAERGVDGALALAELGDAAAVVGGLLARVLTAADEQVGIIRTLLAQGPLAASRTRQLMTSGLLCNLTDDRLTQVLTALTRQRDTAEIASLVVLAPFRRELWSFVGTLGSDIDAAYWRDTPIGWAHRAEGELSLVVDRLLAAGRPRAAFRFVELALRRLPPKQLFRLMTAISTGSGEAAGTYQLEPYRIVEAFRLLDQSGEIAVDEMAALEFKYLEALNQHDGGIPNLERHIGDNPGLFVQAVAFVYRRRDETEDPDALRAASSEIAAERAKGAHSLLERLSRLPGRNRQGDVDSQRLFNWVSEVRAACAELGRDEVCDFQIGKLFSKAPVGEDGVWPCEPVRDVIEQVATARLCEGVRNGLYNSRGAHWRGPGGEQERQLAAKYAAWALALEFKYPNVAKILKKMVRTYEHEGNLHDVDAGVRKRLLR